jgi:calcium-dependent protein kinase
MIDAIKAIKYLHSKNIIHRDIKLENFIFESTSLTSPLILIDFGLSIQSKAGEKLSHMVGSRYYISPEVLLGSYDNKCDLWALGVICFLILSGRTPFQSNVPRDQRESDYHDGILHRQLEFPAAAFADKSDCCKDFIRKLMTKDPDLRMSAEDALKHPFLTGVPRLEYDIIPRKLITKESADQIITNMSIYVSANPLMRVALILLSNSLTIEQITEFRIEFQIMDYNANGVLSLEDLQINLASSDYYSQFDLLTAYETIAIDLSHNRSNGLNYHEFIAGILCTRMEIEESRLESVFSKLDPRDYGYVTANNLAEVLGNDLSADVIKQMISTNNNGNSFVTLEEFKYQFKLMLIGEDSVEVAFDNEMDIRSDSEMFFDEDI